MQRRGHQRHQRGQQRGQQQQRGPQQQHQQQQKSTGQVRLFFAAWPPREAANALADWANEVRREVGGNVTRPESIHLTLAFLGETPSARVGDAALAASAVRAVPHSIPIEKAGFWPHNRILWAGPNEVPAPLLGIAEDLKRVLAEAGFSLERRDFAAHVTLIRQARAPQQLPPLPAIDWPVTDLLLMRSVPSREGSSYESLERFSLDGSF